MSAEPLLGRFTGIAVALGIGVALANGAAVATADRGEGSPSRESASARSNSSADAVAGPKRAARAAGVVKPGIAKPAAATVRAGTARATAAAPSALTPSAPALAPDPKATVTTEYGKLGKWMINKEGAVADWVGDPYCVNDVCKTLQEPINMVFTVPANSKFQAEAGLNRALRRAGFGPSCCSSVGYKGIVGEETSAQMPKGGILGIGTLGPGLAQTGLLNLIAGIGPAYRDALFLLANSHLRTFGGVSDGNGNYVFTGSASKEYLKGLSHGYESFEEARTKLTENLVKRGATAGALIAMDNKIPDVDPTYSTGDHDGKAQVIMLSGMTSLAWRPLKP
jgi:hypothetical protein